MSAQVFPQRLLLPLPCCKAVSFFFPPEEEPPLFIEKKSLCTAIFFFLPADSLPCRFYLPGGPPPLPLPHKYILLSSLILSSGNTKHRRVMWLFLFPFQQPLQQDLFVFLWSFSLGRVDLLILGEPPFFLDLPFEGLKRVPPLFCRHPSVRAITLLSSFPRWTTFSLRRTLSVTPFLRFASLEESRRLLALHGCPPYREPPAIPPVFLFQVCRPRY